MKNHTIRWRRLRRSTCGIVVHMCHARWPVWYDVVRSGTWCSTWCGLVHDMVWYIYGVVWYNVPCTMYQCTIGTWSGNGKVWVVVCSNGSSAGIADPATELLSSTLPRFLQNQFWSGRHHLLLYQKRLRSSLTIEHLQVSLNVKCESD